MSGDPVPEPAAAQLAPATPAFEPPAAWKALATKPSVDNPFGDDDMAMFKQFIQAHMTIREADERTRGKLHALATKETACRGALADSLKVLLAEGQEVPAYVRIPSETPHCEHLFPGATLVCLARRLKKVRMFEPSVLDVALDALCLDDVRAVMVKRLKSMSRLQRATVSENDQAIAAIAALIKARISKEVNTRVWDVTFASSLPRAAARKGVVAQDMPEAARVALGQYCIARNDHQSRKTKKGEVVARARKGIEEVEKRVLDAMLRAKQSSQYFNPQLNHHNVPMFVRVKLSPPIIGKRPSSTSSVNASKTAWEPVVASFLNGDDADRVQCIKHVKAEMERWFVAQSRREVAPAQMRVTLDMAKQSSQ